MFSKFFQDSEFMNVFAIVSMIIFFIAFIIMIILVFRMKKKDLDEQKNLPLKD